MNNLEFEQQYMGCLMFDEPIAYKGLLIYPALMKDYFNLNYFVQSIVIDKNTIPDVKIISMSYLDFLFYNAKMSDKGAHDLDCMFALLCLCLKIDGNDISYVPNVDKNNKIKVSINQSKSFDVSDFFNQVFVDKNKLELLFSNLENPLDVIMSNDIETLSIASDISLDSAKMVIDYFNLLKENNFGKLDIILDSSDFDNIRKIICYQNDIEFPDDCPMNPEIKKAIEESEEFKRRHSERMGTIDHQINYVIANTSLRKDDIKEMSIRKFFDVLSIKDYSSNYNAMLNGLYGGMVQFKEPPKNPLCDLRPKDKYESYVTNYSDIEEKINQVS